MQWIPIAVIALAALVSLIAAQNIGPAPPRLSIPGAIPIPGAVPHRPQFRNEKFSPQGPVVRIRKPIARPPLNAFPVAISPRLLEEAKPVTEEPEEDTPENFVPQLVQQQQQQQPQQQQQQQPNYPPQPQHEQNIIQENPIEEQQPIVIPRFQPQERPQPQPQRADIPTGGQRYSITQDRPKAVVRSRPIPQFREPKPQYDQEQPIQQVRQTRPQSQQVRPIQQQQQPSSVHNEVRDKKPVAQILRKYREEHEDGSITWGFENDDGSFKEETIGIDCVTRGSYGYIDPDGLKREYNYETGILCDPNKRGETAELEQSGYVDYEGKKAVLPNGVEIDLSNMGKTKSKRPGAILQQQVPQQYYRN